MKKNIIKVIIIIGMVGALFVPSISAHSAISNIHTFVSLSKQAKKGNTEISDLQTSIRTSRQKRDLIMESKTKLVSLDNPTELYDAVKALPGVETSTADVISIANGDVAISGPLTASSANGVVPGIQINLTVKDIPTFLNALGKLNTPYLSINISVPAKKVVIRYNTQGGVS